jgi:hypothetical protein
MTVSIWVNTSVCAGGSAYILGNGWGVGNRGYDIALGANFSLRVGDASMTVPCDVATWTNLVFTYDGTTATFYKNGALGSSAAPSSVSTSGNGAGTFRIGMESWGSDTATVPIEYSDVAIYNRAFTATEVASLYAEYATIN